MLLAKRCALVIGAAAALILSLRFLYTATKKASWQQVVHQMPQPTQPVAGLGGEWVQEYAPSSPSPADADNETYYENPRFKSSRNQPPPDGGEDDGAAAAAGFVPGMVKAAGSAYSKTLVIAKTKRENADWVYDEAIQDVRKMVYVVDDAWAKLKVPKNKGHEVMVYLTYIIDNYDKLPDISIFMHAHRYAWHDNDLLYNDGLEMVKRLSSERVTREGYMNLRCHWMPGCPDWMRPGTVVEDVNKEEQTVMAQAWMEIFPDKQIPSLLAQPCCAQFALSRARIRARDVEQYKFWREWVLRTPIEDYISGRVWEYLWQVVFTDKAVGCPNQWTCYCDGYGVCFENEEDFDSWFEMRWKRHLLIEELQKWTSKMGDYQEEKTARMAEIEAEKRQLEDKMEEAREAAIKRGNNASFRAFSAGRKWVPGDGF